MNSSPAQKSLGCLMNSKKPPGLVSDFFVWRTGECSKWPDMAIDYERPRAGPRRETAGCRRGQGSFDRRKRGGPIPPAVPAGQDVTIAALRSLDCSIGARRISLS